MLSNENNYGILLQTNFTGLSFLKGKRIDGYKNNLFLSNILYYKHPKETNSTSSNYDWTSTYTYGKLNNLIILNLLKGQQKTIYSKDRDNNKSLEIRRTYSYGLSIGLLKPVYIQRVDSIYYSKIYYTEVHYNPLEHNSTNILGRASIFAGLNKTIINPGINLNYGYGFEFGSERNNTKLIELGVSIFVFMEKPEIMYLVNNNQYFISLYCKIGIGKRWY